jgi:ABC-type Mn/Zn transport systems, ATPase component
MAPDRFTVVRARHLSYRIGRHVILQDLNFDVHRGEFVAILGPNGAGKTTLIRLILGILRPTSGELTVLGHPPHRMPRSLRRRIGYVPQLLALDLSVPVTVEEVVRMGRYVHAGWTGRLGSADREAVRRALARVGLEGLERRMLRELSGGQRQRVFLARALATEPELLVLDEPTTSLDPSMTEGLYDLLQELRKSLDLTVILVSHDVGIVMERADTVACLSGRLVAHGRPRDVLTRATLECMYGKHAVAFGHGVLPHMIVDPHPPSEENAS